MSTQAKHIFQEFDKQIHAESTPQKYKWMPKIMKEKRVELQNIQKMDTKQIQETIYREEKKTWAYKEIWKGKIRKQIGFNYMITQ